MQKIYPFKFLDSYQREDKDVFFGRNEEIEALYQMIFQTKVLVIYGTSGTGKTSLIQCGLANKFQPYDWLALYIRRGANLVSALDRALCAESDGAFEYESSEGAGISDLEAKIEAVYMNSFKPIYLIFDQFEELYVLGTKAEQQQFIQTVKEILTIKQPVKIILSVREEYLGYLYEFEKEVPQLLKKKLRVEPMTLDKVNHVISGINEYQHSLVKIKEDEIDAFTEEIFERLKGKEKTLTIQLPYLQVFLDKLYINKTHDDNHQTEAVFSLEDLKQIGDIDDVLQNFLEEQVKKISRDLSTNKKVVTSETIWKVLSNFCTLEGTKEPISKKELVERLKNDLDKKLIDQSIEAFTKSRIVKKSEEEDLYELTHDSLALRIADKRSEDDISRLEVKRLIKSQASLKEEYREEFTEKQINFIDPYLKELEPELTVEEKKLIADSKKTIELNRKKREEEEKKKKRVRAIWFYAIVSCIIIGLVISGIIGNKRLYEYRLLSDTGKIQNVIASANSNVVRVADIREKDPTLALQLNKQAFYLLDSARRIDTLRDRNYYFNASEKEAAYRHIDSNFTVTDSVIKKQAFSIFDKDYAFYKVVRPVNLQDTIFDQRFVNALFPDPYNDTLFGIWRAEQWIIDSIYNHGPVAQVVFPIAANEAMVLYRDQTAHYWGTKEYYRPLIMKKGYRITSIAPIRYNVIGYKMLTALNNKRIVEWNLNGTIRESSEKKVIYHYMADVDFHDSIVSIAISPNRSKIFTASDNGIGVIWPADTSEVELLTGKKKAFSLLQDTIICSAFSNDGKLIVTGSVDHSVKIWNAEDGTPVKVLYGHAGPVTSVAFSASDKYLYTASLDRTFLRWRMPKAKSVAEMDSVRWNRVSSPDSLFIQRIIEPYPVKRH